MASTDRSAQSALISLVAQDPYRFDFFQAMRLLECAYQDQPRFGTSKKASDDPIRLGQDPELTFFASSIASFDLARKSRQGKTMLPRLAINLFGLFGPNGALPLHITEYARERLTHHRDPTLARFIDIFHHRMMCLFYRAWANSQPTVSYDRPQDDRFADYIGSLLGIGTDSLRNRDSMSDHAKLFYSGVLSAQNKCPEGLLTVIAGILSVPVSLEEFVGEWMEITMDDQTCLGHKNATLGQSALIGSGVYGCQHKFRLNFVALTLKQYLNLLPGSHGLNQLLAIVRNYVGDEYTWDVNLSLKHDEVPAELALGKPAQQGAKPTHLGGMAQLGWTTWLGPRNSVYPANDLLLNPFNNIASSHRVIN